MIRKKTKSKTKSRTKSSSRKISKKTSSKKSAKRRSSRNPDDYRSERMKEWEEEQVFELQKYYPGTLTPAKLRKLKDEAYEIDKLYRNGKAKQWEKEEDSFRKKNGKLAGILLESAQADSCPYAAKC